MTLLSGAESVRRPVRQAVALEVQRVSKSPGGPRYRFRHRLAPPGTPRIEPKRLRTSRWRLGWRRTLRVGVLPDRPFREGQSGLLARSPARPPMPLFRSVQVISHAVKLCGLGMSTCFRRAPRCSQGCPAREERVSVSEVCRVHRRRCADSERQQERAGVSETDSRPLSSASALVSAWFLLILGECPRQDSNLRTRLRRPFTDRTYALVRASLRPDSGVSVHK